MSFLYPLFLAGIAAISLPIVLHLVRRHTRNRVTFSSLMFLRTTMPRLRNRGRLENLPLLVLRCIVLCLLAFAFARPFFSRPAVENSAGAKLGRRIVLLIDTSASMQRAGMWAQTMSEARSLLEDVSQTDRVRVMTFDRSTQTLIGFEQWGALDFSQRASIGIEHLSKLLPSWAMTNLGHALVTAAEAIEDDEVEDRQSVSGRIAARQVVLISDLQEGSNLEALRAYEWPKGVELVVKLISCEGPTNAALQLVAGRSGLADPGGDGHPSIRIINSPDATNERFHLNWADDAPAIASSQTTETYVPAGHSIVVQAPARANGSVAGKLILTGDDHDFDNALYVTPQLQQQVNILYIGSDDPNDSREMLYYVRRAFGDTGALKFRVISRPGNEAIAATDIETAYLIIVADTINQENIVTLRRYLESGRTLLLVMKSAPPGDGSVTTLAGLAGIGNLKFEEADIEPQSRRGYAMLGRIEFKHPLLAPFCEPRFGDFTRIHFWKYRRINIADCPGAQVLAWFDSNDPAWFEILVGKGSLLVLTCGWHPSDSDLALSSKFVPLLYSILEYGGVFTGQQSQYFVGEPVPIPSWLMSGSANLQIRKPDNSLVRPDPGLQTFVQTDRPGFYAVESTAGNQLFAVNLTSSECRTAPMPIEDLEKLGVSLKQSYDAAIEKTGQTSHHSSISEMEYEQKLWRWVLIAILAVLLIEIWLAGWLTRPSAASHGEQQ